MKQTGIQTIAKTPLQRAGATDTNQPLLKLPIPGQDMMTTQEAQQISSQDFEEATQRRLAQEQAGNQEPPPIQSEDDYTGFEQPTGEAYETPTPVLADAVIGGIQSQAEENINVDPAEEQRERERIQSIPEMWGVKTLAGIYATVNDESNMMYGPMHRASRMGNVNVAKMLSTELSEWMGTGDPESAFTIREKNKNKDWKAKFPAMKDSITETDQKNILYNPRLLDAGLWNPELEYKGGKGGIQLDEDFLQTMSLVTEQFYVQGLHTRAEEDFETVADLNDPESTAVNVASYTKAEGRKQLGKDIFQQWKRVQATKRGIPTDTYAADFKSINDEVFEQLGDFAKESYFLVNQDLMQRKILSDKQVRFSLTPEGNKLFNDTYYMYSAMFGANEVAPMAAPSEDGQMVFEGQTYTRRVTTGIGDLGNTTHLFEAMANMNKVVIRNDPQRERAAFMYAGAAISTAENPEIVNGQIANDFNERELTEVYFNDGEGSYSKRLLDLEVPNTDIQWSYNPKEPNYANMFGIGTEKFESLLQEKARLYAAAYDMEQKGLAVNQSGWGFDLYLSAKMYNPKSILDKEREKLISILDGANRYSGKNNYLTFAMQALTGRMHSQQTLYNPQAHKVLRYIVGGGNTYQWTPGKGNLDFTFIETMSAHLFENPKVPGVENFKKKYGIARTPKERIKVFKEEEANANNPDSLFMKYVRWGEELEKITTPFNSKAAGNLFTQFRNASGNPQARGQVIGQLQRGFNNDPLSPDLKAYLAKFEQESILQTDYLINLAKYHRIKKHNKENPNQPQVFRSSIVLEIDGRTHGPATLATLLGSESMAKRSGIIMKQDFQEMLGGEYKDLRDAMMDSMDSNFEKISGGISYITDEKRSYWKAILQAAFEDRENFLKKSPMTMGYGQEIQSLRQHVDTTVFQSKEINNIMAEQKLKPAEVIDFLHTMLVGSIYDTMDINTIRAAKLIKTTGYLSALSGVLFQLPQPTGLLSTIAGKDSRQKGQSSYTLSFTDPETGKVKALTESQQMNVQQYESITSPAAMRKMFGQTVLGGYATGRLLPALIQAFDANMVTGVFSDAKVGPIVGTDKNGNPIYGKSITTNNWSKIQAAAKANGAENVFVLPIFDAFLTDLGTNAAVREVANKVYQDSLIEGQMMEKVVDYYENTLVPQMKEINSSESFDWKDPANRYFMLQQLFAEGNLKDPAPSLKKAIEKLSWDEEFKWQEGLETLSEWQQRTKGLSKKRARQVYTAAAAEMKLTIPQFEQLMNGDKITGGQAKILISLVTRILSVPSNMRWAKTEIPKARADIKNAIAEGRVANIDNA